MKAPEYIIEAVLDTMKLGMVYCRNYSLNKNSNMAQINELMDAMHEVPSILSRWPEGALEEIKLHLSCFDHRKWEGSPNLTSYLENVLEQAKT